MPIANYSPVAPMPQPNAEPVIEPSHYEGIVRDYANSSTLALAAYVEGSSWQVDEYFSQLLGKNNDLREVDVSSPNVYQQYQCIERLEIKVSSDISDSYNEQDATMTVSGSGLIYGVIVPKKADYFTAKSFHGRKSIFLITSVTRTSANSETVYEISYTAVGYADVQIDIYNQLKERTVRRFVFVKDRLINGVNPLVRPEARDFVMGIAQNYARMALYYINSFFSRDCSTLLLPGQSSKIFDPSLVAFIMKTISSRTVDRIKYIRQLPTDGNAYLLQATVFGPLLSRNKADLDLCTKRSMLLARTTFLNRPYGRGAAYTNVDYFVCPKDLDMSIMPTGALYPAYASEHSEVIVETKNVEGQTVIALNSEYTESGWTVPTIYPILEDDFYVFSENFYNKTNLMSLIEILTHQYLNNEPLNHVRMSHLMNDFYKWPRLEQFYYGPVVLTLLRHMQFQE